MQLTPAFSVCVYCGSRNGASPAYVDVAKTVGQWIGAHNGQLVYGGGNNGLMGVVAQAAADAGARVVGIIPKALQTQENTRTACTELHVVDTMHERKRMMAERADAFIALPGGIGTFEEFFEVWTWRQLGYHDKPIGLLNTEGYYDGLLNFAQKCATRLSQRLANGAHSQRQRSHRTVERIGTSCRLHPRAQTR